MPALLPIHIIAAAIGLLAGAVALAVTKGMSIHRGSGKVFVYAICAMCASAVSMAVAKGQAVNVMAGSLTAYLALTGMTTVWPASERSRRRDVGLMIAALTLGLATAFAGLLAFVVPSGKVFGYPPPPFLLFGILGLSAAFGDWRTLRSGPLRGGPRLKRHLWRMCMALFITAASFFSIRSRVVAIFPDALATPLARTLPVLIVLVAMFYWLWRLRSRVVPQRA